MPTAHITREQPGLPNTEPPIDAREAAQLLNRAVMDMEVRKPPLESSTIKVVKNLIGRRSNGQYVIEERPDSPHMARAETASQRPGKVSGLLQRQSAESLIRDLFNVGSEAYLTLNDSEAWTAAAKVAERAGLRGNDLRTFSRAIFAALVVRAGGRPPDVFSMP